MTQYLRRTEGLDSVHRYSDLIALANRDPYWGEIRTAFERAVGLFFDGHAVHIVPFFEDSIPLHAVKVVDKILIPIMVAGTQKENGPQVEVDLEGFARYIGDWLSFVPALMFPRDPFEDLGDTPTQQ